MASLALAQAATPQPVSSTQTASTAVARLTTAQPASANQASKPATSQTGQTPRAATVDQQVERRVRRILAEDPCTRGFAAEATVRNGTVTLAGHTYSSQARATAEKAAIRVSGARAIRDLIVVETNPDLEIARELHAAFSKDPLIDDAAIGVAVINRKVYLSGGSEPPDAIERMNQLALSIPGVIAVSNGIQKAPASYRAVRPPTPSRYGYYSAPRR